jgi:NAD(P)H-dependent FMN reductase
MTSNNHYDVIIIGTGAGGGTLAYSLAPSGKKILLLERGDYVPREKDNWSTRAVLDSNLKEYIHKAVGIGGISAGGFGGTRVIQSLLPVLRELGLIMIFWDGNFSGAASLFDQTGEIKDHETQEKRLDKFLGELIWMSRVLRYGRENISI